ncbi:MAG: hypothetical protein ACOCQ5_04110, partial [Halanaerobiales bacterium]
MNSKKIICKTLEFNNPDRVGRSFKNSDFVSVSHEVDTPATDWNKVEENRWERIDAWGNIWSRVDPTSKGEVIEGALEDIEKAAEYQFPDF